MAADCKERILSNDYSDWVTNYELTEDLLQLSDGNEDYCYRQIDEQLGLLFLPRNRVNPVGLLNYAYQRIPGIFGLQQETLMVTGEGFDPSPLISSGITQVQREPLNLTGRGCILAFIDTGEGVRQIPAPRKRACGHAGETA